MTRIYDTKTSLISRKFYYGSDMDKGLRMMNEYDQKRTMYTTWNHTNVLTRTTNYV